MKKIYLAILRAHKGFTMLYAILMSNFDWHVLSPSQWINIHCKSRTLKPHPNSLTCRLNWEAFFKPIICSDVYEQTKVFSRPISNCKWWEGADHALPEIYGGFKWLGVTVSLTLTMNFNWFLNWFYIEIQLISFVNNLTATNSSGYFPIGSCYFT